MVSHWRSVLYVLLPIAWILTGSEVVGLSCKFCQSVNNYSSCVASVGEVPCTDALVNMTHLLLQPHNPSLAKATPSLGQYQCFQVNFTTAGVWNYHMGCTLVGSNICTGWKVLSQCKVMDERRQISSGKAGPTGGVYAGITPTVKDFPSGSSKVAVAITSTTVRSTNVSIVLSTLTPKLTTIPTGKHDSSSQAATFSPSQLEILLVLWIVVSMWNYC